MNNDDNVEVLRHYSLARSHFAAQQAIVLLHIGPSESWVLWGDAGAPPHIRRVSAGALAFAGKPYRHDPPTPIELEDAIAEVEDALMPLARSLPRPAALVATGHALRALVDLIDTDAPELAVTREAVENLFQQLTAISSLGTAGVSGLPRATGYPGTLLILREFMHHLAFDTALVLPDRRDRDAANA